MVMAVVTSYLFLSPPISLHSPSAGWVSQCPVSPKRAPIMAASSPSAPLADGARLSRLLEFPHVSAAHRDLLVEVVTAFEARLGSHLLPCTLPPDVEYYENQDGTAQASLNIRSGRDSSPVIESFSSIFLSKTRDFNFVCSFLKSIDLFDLVEY